MHVWCVCVCVWDVYVKIIKLDTPARSHTIYAVSSLKLESWSSPRLVLTEHVAVGKVCSIDSVEQNHGVASLQRHTPPDERLLAELFSVLPLRCELRK